jgi:hypothetical protein
MKYTETMKSFDAYRGLTANYPSILRIADQKNHMDYLNIYIGDLIAENRDNRFVVMADTDEVKIWRDTFTDRIFGLEKGYSDENRAPTRKWHELFIAAAMGEEDFHNDNFSSDEDMDDFYDSIGYCPFECTVTHNGVKYILWLDYYVRSILTVPEVEYEDLDYDEIPF